MKVSNVINDGKGRAGVSVFYDKDVIVYVGISGKKDQDLQKRIEFHSKPSSKESTLRKNICKKDKCLDEEALKKIKGFTVKIVICGAVGHANYEKSNRLKKILIKLLKPKYN